MLLRLSGVIRVRKVKRFQCSGFPRVFRSDTRARGHPGNGCLTHALTRASPSGRAGFHPTRRTHRTHHSRHAGTPPCGGTTVAATRGERAGKTPLEHSRRRSSGWGVRRNRIPPKGSSRRNAVNPTTPTRYFFALDGLCTEHPRALRAVFRRNYADLGPWITMSRKLQVDSSAYVGRLTGSAARRRWAKLARSGQGRNLRPRPGRTRRPPPTARPTGTGTPRRSPGVHRPATSSPGPGRP